MAWYLGHLPSTMASLTVALRLRSLMVTNPNGVELWIEDDYFCETVKDNKTACIIHGPFRYFTPDRQTEIKARCHQGYLHGALGR
jgi:hypothetical protein